MPRPLPRRQSSSLPPPPRRAYTPYIDDAEADDYFQSRGRRSSTPGPGHGHNYTRRAESAHNHHQNHDRRRPSSRDSYHRLRTGSNLKYHDPRDEEERGRHRYRPSRSADNYHRRHHPSSSSSSSSSSSISSSPSTSRSSSTTSSLSSHHFRGHGHKHRHRHPRRNHQTGTTKDKNYYPPSSSSYPKKKPPLLTRLRSQSLPTHHRGRPLLKNPADLPPGKRSPSEIFLRATQCAVEAGAVAALKMRDDPSPWLGSKGTKVVAAALSAAAVDTFMEQKHPKRKGGVRHTVMRQLTQMAIGNLVKPVVGGHDGGGGKGGGRVHGRVHGWR